MTTSPNSNSSYLNVTARALGPLDWIALVLVIVGGLNWAAVGIAGVDVVAAIFGPMTLPSRIVYVLVGLAAVYLIVAATKMRRVATPTAA